MNMTMNASVVAATRRAGRVRTVPARVQRGMALVIALIVLVVISILGVVAMRTALFQNRVSINSQTYNLAFHGAESGLAAALELYNKEKIQQGFNYQSLGGTFYQAFNNIHKFRVCYDQNGALTSDYNATQPMGANQVPSGPVTYTVPCPTLPNANVTVTTVIGLSQKKAIIPGLDFMFAGAQPIEVRSYANVPNTNMQTVHVQQYLAVTPNGSGG